jgi:2-keto-4-pentenoate hydratase
MHRLISRHFRTLGDLMIGGMNRAARAILEARRTGALLDALAPNDQPRSLEEGYTIQQIVTAEWPDKIAGWKVGATSKEVQALLGISEPAYGPVFKNDVFQSPAAISGRRFPHRLLESEFAFTFGKAMRSRPKHYTRDEIIDAVDALLPAFEIISPRFTSFTGHPASHVIADFCGNGGAVLGKLCSDWRNIDLSSHVVSLSINGAERQRGTGAIVLDSPLNVLDWFVNRLSQHGGELQAGQFVMTGTTTGLHALESSHAAKADFGLLGAVEVVFT